MHSYKTNVATIQPFQTNKQKQNNNKKKNNEPDLFHSEHCNILYERRSSCPKNVCKIEKKNKN